ncbi:hypothetical protein AAE478_007312 [Parahypoxylon ruwenzoriense]
MIIANNSTLWAPDVVYIRDIYYCFYSVSTFESHKSAIGYATSTTLESGSWKDQGIVITSTDKSPYHAIDSNVVNGTGPNEWYLQWGSYWNNIYQSRVAINGEYVFRSGNEHQIAYEPSGIHRMEGTFIWKRNNLWYQFLSRGICCVYHPDTDPIDQVYHITARTWTKMVDPAPAAEVLPCSPVTGKSTLRVDKEFSMITRVAIFYIIIIWTAAWE